MRRLLVCLSIILLCSINTYAEDNSTASVSDTKASASVEISLKNILRAIDEDSDFSRYLLMKGIDDDMVAKAINSKEFRDYARKELATVPEEDDVSANWDIWQWHIDKLESFLEKLCSGNNNSNSSNNRYNNNNNENGYNNMMPPPMQYGNNNGWGQYPPMPPNPYNRHHRNNYNNWSGGRCNCNCSNCSNCMYK